MRVWLNLHKACISDAKNSTWHVVTHELPPTNESLAAINLTDTKQCTLCGAINTLQHRITRCLEGRVIWTWVRARIAAITRTNPQYIPEEWTLRPDFLFGTLPKQAALVCLLAHLVEYRMQDQRRLSLQDYTDFMRRTPWKAYLRPTRRLAVGNYLDVL